MEVFVIDFDGWVQVSCPYCGESLTIHVDPESEGEWVQDCEVCCQPWQLNVDRRHPENPQVRIDIL